MKIYIVTDLEGAAMVFSFDQTRLPEAEEKKPEAMRILTREVNACVGGILDVETDAEVIVLDGHGSGGITYELFHDQAQLIAGSGRGGVSVLDASFDALFYVGQHAMAGTADAPLAHTYSSKTIEYYKLNGQPIGEFGMGAYRAGILYGVPAAFLSGDDKAVAEARALVPEIVGVVTKYGLGLETARSLGPGRARDFIRTGAADAVRRVQAGAIPPLRLDPPYTLEVRMLPGHERGIEPLLKRGFERLDERTAMLHTDNPRAIPRWGNETSRPAQ